MSAILEREAVATGESIDSRMHAIDWARVGADLDAHSYTILERALSEEECERIARLYDSDDRFRSHMRYPSEHEKFLARCHAAGQKRPTPLLLQYGKDDFNALHQDLYGEHVFPFQVAFLLSKPGKDFTGGEFVLTEQRPRMQSRAEVVPLHQGDAVIFAVQHRPVQGKRGIYRVNLRHGVSRLRSGHRHTVGVIFHDAA